MGTEKTTTAIRILVVDNHPIVRSGLTMLLKHEPGMEAIAEASNGVEAVALFRQHTPDITLMDVRMPERNGIEATVAIRAEFPQARIILLSTYDGDEEIYRGLQSGAKAYVFKDSPCEELLATIRTVHSGQKCISPGASAKLVERMMSQELTERESEVLRLMAKGYSNQEIAGALFIAEGTAKFHVNHILTKLSVSDRTQAVLVALKRGIVSLT